MLITIYRIENGDGLGPYVGADHWMWQTKMHIPPNNPSPCQDPGLKENWDQARCHEYKYGFKSLEQLGEWFSPKELKRLHRLGFEIKTYRVLKSQCFIGTKQLMFHKESVAA